MQTADFTWLFIKMLLALLVAVATAVFVLRYVVPKLSWTQKLQQNAYFKILARFVLEPKKALYLVKVGKKNWVLGSSEAGLQKVGELTDEEVG